MIEQWEELAKRVNRLLCSKLAVPLTGADMVWIVEAWKQMGKEGNHCLKTHCTTPPTEGVLMGG